MVFICRLCGKCENDSLGVSIFGEQGETEALAYKIKLSLDISVFEYDPLPKYICECCLGKLITTFTFQESCRRVQILLREHFLSSNTWSLNAATSTAEVEQLPNESIHGTAGETPIQERTLYILDNSYSQISETAHNQNEVNEICIEEHCGNLFTVTLAPSELRNLQTQPSFVSTESAVGNIQTVNNSRPQLEQPRTETQLTICGEPFNFSTFLRNGVLEEHVQAVGNKESKKSNTRKTRKPPVNASARKKQKAASARKKQKAASARKKQKASSGLEPPAPIAKETFAFQRNTMVSAHTNMAVSQQAVNKPVSSGDGNHGASEVHNSSTITSGENLPETMQIEEVFMRPNVYVAPGAYGTPQIVALVNVQEHTLPSQLEDTEAETNNTLKIVDVFSAHEMPSTSTPEFGTSTLQSFSKWNWHSSSPTEDQSNSLPSLACSIQSSSTNPSTIRNWHTPVPVNSPHKSSIEKEEVVDSGSTLNHVTLPEEEDEVLVVEIVKANKEAIAQHWERCPSGFLCKYCNKQYRSLNKCENHIRIHLGVKPYECQICKHRYHKKRMLNEHYAFHTGKKLYQCKKCDKSFRYRKNFKSHAECHVEEFNSRYFCEICNKNFQLQFDYWSHKTSKHVIVESQMTEEEMRE